MMKITFLTALGCFLLIINGFSQTSHTGMRGLTGLEIAAEMAPGLNLFNTLDANCGETCWGNPYTTPEMVQAFADRGFKTLRIPVTWGSHTGAGPDYSIDTAWMNRVEEVANYAFDANMYVIINIHHDDEWMVPTYEKQEEATAQLEKTWEQIAERFKEYGDYLIFETMNEPRELGHDAEWTGGTPEHRDVVNQFNKAAVDIIRASGGHNDERFIMVMQVGANPGAAKEALIIPNDDPNILVSVHNYNPYFFCLADEAVWGTESDQEALRNDIMSYYDHWVSKGQAVVLGEWGANNSGNYADRVAYYETMGEACVAAQVTPISWIYEFDRNEMEWKYPLIEEGIFRAYKDSVPTVEDLTFGAHIDTLYIGDSLQLDFTYTAVGAVSSTTFAWSSHNARVAEVDVNGMLYAKFEGKADLKVGYFAEYDMSKIVVLDASSGNKERYEAEEYTEQSGVQVESCGDVDGGENIGYIDDGDWCTYKITIDTAGVYEFVARVATDGDGGTIELSKSGDLLGELTVDSDKSTGWQDWYTTDPTEVTMEEGTYEVKLTFTAETSPLFNVNWFKLNFIHATSVEDASLASTINAYPNPVNGILNIDFSNEVSQIVLYSIEGKLMQQVAPSGNNASIDVSNYESGVYVLMIATGENVIVNKILVE